MMRLALQIGLTVMAGFLFKFAEIFKPAKDALDRHPYRSLAELHRHDVEEWEKILPHGDRR